MVARGLFGLVSGVLSTFFWVVCSFDIGFIIRFVRGRGRGARGDGAYEGWVRYSVSDIRHSIYLDLDTYYVTVRFRRQGRRYQNGDSTRFRRGAYAQEARSIHSYAYFPLAVLCHVTCRSMRG